MRKLVKTAALASLGLLLSLQNSNAQTVSDFENLNLPSANSFFDGSDLSGFHNAGIFEAAFQSGDAIFPNVYDTSYGAIYGYMSAGFAFTNKEDSSTAGESFSSFAFGTPMGSKYAVGKNGSMIHLTGATQGTTITGVYVTNSTYSGISMRDGDYFGKVFGDSLAATGHSSVNDGTNGEDWFLLTVQGYTSGAPTANKVEFYLADFRFTNNAQDYIVNTWQWVDLTPLGNVDSVEFLLTSSDTTGGYGMNTPNFFCLDNFNGVGPSSVNEMNNNITVGLYPNPTKNFLNITTNEYINTIEVINVTGEVVLTSVSTRVDVSSLSDGAYFVRVHSDNGISTQRFLKH